MTISLLACSGLASLTCAVASVPRQLPKRDATDEKAFVIQLVDDCDQPLSDVRVYLDRYLRRAGGTSSARIGPVGQRTDDDGRVLLIPDNNWPADASVRIDLPGDELVGMDYRGPLVPWDGEAGEVRVVVPRPGWVEGRILSRTPVAPVLFGPHHKDMNRLEVDEQGHFLIGPYAAGEHEFEFW